MEIVGVIVSLLFAGVILRTLFPKTYERINNWLARMGDEKKD